MWMCVLCFCGGMSWPRWKVAVFMYKSDLGHDSIERCNLAAVCRRLSNFGSASNSDGSDNDGRRGRRRRRRQNSSHCIEPSTISSAPFPLRSDEEFAAEEGAVVCGGDGGNTWSSTGALSAQDVESVVV